MKKHARFILILASFLLAGIVFTGCFSEKDSPFYDSEWHLENFDAQGQPYFHDLTFEPNHIATLKVMYTDTLDGFCWTGKYKINSKKVVFDFTDCIRYKNEEISDRITSGKVINFYTGEFFYSVAEIEIQNRTDNSGVDNTDNSEWRLQLIRPKNYFYGGNKDILGNQLDEFVKLR